MRIGIISDTHDHRARTSRAVDALMDHGAEALIHCGDLTGPEIVQECGLLPSFYVFGNNDFDKAGLRAAMRAVGGVCLEYGALIELGGKRIAVTHGDLPSEFRRLLLLEPDYLLFGHTHVPMDERDGPIRQINPGALHRADEWTVALLDVDSDNLDFVKIR